MKTTAVLPAKRGEDTARFVLRRAQYGAPGLVEELHGLYANARPNNPVSTEFLQEWLDHGGVLYITDQHDRPLAALLWREAAGGWRVDPIATLQDQRGNGFGRWLMTQLEALAIRSNIPFLETRIAREDLLPYYKRLGYRVVEGLTLRKAVGGQWQEVSA